MPFEGEKFEMPSKEKTEEELFNEEREKKVREIAYDVFQKREAGKEPGYGWAETDEMLKDKGITPGTEEARQFLEKWDWEQAERTLRKRESEQWNERLGTRQKERIAEAGRELTEEKAAVAEAEKVVGKEVELPVIDKETGVSKQEVRKEEAKVGELVGAAAEKGGIGDPVVEKAGDCLEAVAQPEIKVIEQDQEKREKKISGLAEVKEVGTKRLRKVEEGLAYLAAPDRLALAGLKEAGEFAVKSGKTLGWLGLSPLAAIEKGINNVIGTVEFGTNAARKFMAEAEIKTIEAMPEELRANAYHLALESAEKTSELTSKKMAKAVERRRGKGVLARFIEKYFK